MARSKAYLFRRRRDPLDLRPGAHPRRRRPAEATFHFPNGLADFLAERIERASRPSPPSPSPAACERKGEAGAVEWAVTWTPAGFGEADSFMQSYCNTVPTPEGGTHEAGFRAALTTGLKAYAELTGEKRGGPDHRRGRDRPAPAPWSRVFIRNPEFQGQTKERLSSPDAQRLVETALRDPFDHWLTAQPEGGQRPCCGFVIERAEERLKRRKDKEVARASATRKLRLPGKLADCSRPGRRRHRAVHRRGRLGRRLGQAGARPQAPRRSCPCAARS